MDAGMLNTGHKPDRKRPRIRPNGYLPGGFEPRYWALWGYEWRWSTEKGQWDLYKPTYSPRTLRKFRWREQDGHWGESLRLGLWGSFGEVLQAYGEHANRFDGIGYVIEPSLPLPGTEVLYYVVTDLDGCRDPETGEIEPWAREIIDEQDTFCELSPSGEGVHLIGTGNKRPGSKMVFEVGGHRVENYGGGIGRRRFITYTGVTP